MGALTVGETLLRSITCAALRLFRFHHVRKGMEETCVAAITAENGLPRLPTRHLSDRHPVTVEFVVLVETALALSDLGEICNKLDRFDPFDLLEAQFVLAAKP